MEFDPEYAQPMGGNLPSAEYLKRRDAMHKAADEAAGAHEEVALKHQDAIQSYTWDSTALNHHLVNRKASLKRNHPSAVAKLDSLQQRLSQAVQEAPAAHADMHIFSGISPKHADNLLKAGDKAKLKAWGSFSHNPEVAGKFGSGSGLFNSSRGTILHIHVREGQKVGIHCESASLHPNERETLVPPGTKLRINKVYEPSGPNRRRIISAEIVD